MQTRRVCHCCREVTQKHPFAPVLRLRSSWTVDADGLEAEPQLAADQAARPMQPSEPAQPPPATPDSLPSLPAAQGPAAALQLPSATPDCRCVRSPNWGVRDPTSSAVCSPSFSPCLCSWVVSSVLSAAYGSDAAQPCLNAASLCMPASAAGLGQSAGVPPSMA